MADVAILAYSAIWIKIIQDFRVMDLTSLGRVTTGLAIYGLLQVLKKPIHYHYRTRRTCILWLLRHEPQIF